jgi:hypothetical protein
MMAQILRAAEQLKLAEEQAHAAGLAAPPAGLATPAGPVPAPPPELPPPLAAPHVPPSREEGSALDHELTLIDGEIAHLQQALEAATQQAQTASAKAG